MYKLYTLILKQTMLPVLDMMSFFFRIYTKVKAIVLPTSAFTCVLILEKKLVISNTRPLLFCLNCNVSYI